jgi:hypothetical protein
MHDVLMRLLEALPAGVDVFIRDDDAGWNDAQLLALLDVTERCGVPIDLAAIPGAMSSGLARFLRARIAAAPGLVGIHQHGSTHLNHESEGRKCEFGVSRGAAAQRADLARGRAQLREHFGDLLQPVFTPPWNRCTEATPALLAELGFAALSRDRGARPAQHALQELAVDVDWSKHWRTHGSEGGASAVVAAFAHALHERAADGQPLGLMLHHAVMQQEERAALQELLGALAHHPRLRWRSMRELLVPMAPMNETTACTTFA